MEKCIGKSLSDKIVSGRVCFYEKNNVVVRRAHIDDADDEIARFNDAVEAAIDELDGLYRKTKVELGDKYATIFKAHEMILNDDQFIEEIKYIISRDRLNAEYAVAITCEKLTDTFMAMEDNYMRERAVDIADVTECVIRKLAGVERSRFVSEESVIALADDIKPSDIIWNSSGKIAAFVLRHGSRTSHACILAASRGIPVMIDTDMGDVSELEGKMAVFDGESGILFVEPDEKTLDLLIEKTDEKKLEKKDLDKLRGVETTSSDGHKLALYGSVSDEKDYDAVIDNDAEGIGLFRTEYIFMAGNDFPDEEKQFEIYKNAAQKIKKRIIIRTVDIGADKKPEYIKLEHEENPSMGVRGVRYCFENQDIFKTQLRAIYRASAFGNIDVMFPMITSVSEVERILDITEEVKQSLSDKGIAYGRVARGIMIETPAAVIMSDNLARIADFFSIGTNDLTQFSLACDREGKGVQKYMDMKNPAVLRMIKMTVKNAHRAGITCGICGELAEDAELIPLYLAMGVDSLSVSADRILSVRNTVRKTNVTLAEADLKEKYL